MIKNYNEPFENIEELCKNIARGGEVEFQYKGKNYTITHVIDGIYIMKAYNYDTEKTCKSAEQIGEYVIDGEKLENIISRLKITFRCY